MVLPMIFGQERECKGRGVYLCLFLLGITTGSLVSFTTIFDGQQELNHQQSVLVFEETYC